MADGGGWLSRAADFIRKQLGIGEGAQAPPPSAQPIIPPQPETPPSGKSGPPPSRGGPPFLPSSENHDFREVDYLDRHKYVLPRWKIGEEGNGPSVGEVERLIKSAKGRNTQGYYTFVVTGRPNRDSPKRARERDPESEPITLSFVKTERDVWDAMWGARSSEEFMNNLTGGIEALNWREVHSIDIVDR